MIRTDDKNWLVRRAKAIETHNLKQYRASAAWVTILSRLKSCIVCVYDDSTDIDTEQYAKIRDSEMQVKRNS